MVDQELAKSAAFDSVLLVESAELVLDSVALPAEFAELQTLAASVHLVARHEEAKAETIHLEGKEII